VTAVDSMLVQPVCDRIHVYKLHVQQCAAKRQQLLSRRLVDPWTACSHDCRLTSSDNQCYIRHKACCVCSYVIHSAAAICICRFEHSHAVRLFGQVLVVYRLLRHLLEVICLNTFSRLTWRQNTACMMLL
jgi:hypothetical protein